MIFFGIAFVASFAGVFAWLAIKAVRTKILSGPGWRLSRADRPVSFWLYVCAYLFVALVSLLFLLVLLTAAFDPNLR